MPGKASLITAIETLSPPGALLDGKDSTTLRTFPYETGRKKELIKRHRDNTFRCNGWGQCRKVHDLRHALGA